MLIEKITNSEFQKILEVSLAMNFDVVLVCV